MIHRLRYAAFRAPAVIVALCLALNLTGIRAGTIAMYRFENTGADVVDSVDNQVQGTTNASYSTDVPVNPVPQTHDSNNYSLQLGGGTSASITAQPFIFNNVYGDATLEFWLKAPNQPNGDFFWTRGDSADLNRFNIFVFSGGNLGFDYREPNGTLHTLVDYTSGIFNVPFDRWTFIAVTRTANTYRFYEDSTLVTTATDVNPNLPNSPSWTISGRSPLPYTGLIDEVRFSDTALSPNQFLDAPTATPVPSTLVMSSILFAMFGVIWSYKRLNQAAAVT